LLHLTKATIRGAVVLQRPGPEEFKSARSGVRYVEPITLGLLMCQRLFVWKLVVGKKDPPDRIGNVRVKGENALTGVRIGDVLSTPESDLPVPVGTSYSGDAIQIIRWYSAERDV
jgi:hypothetical protein